MSENQRRLTRARFFEVPFTQKLRNAYISTEIIAMHSIECKLIEVKEAKTLQQMLHSFLHAQERTINPQDSGFRCT